MKTTFVNARKDERKDLRIAARQYMLSRVEDFNFYRLHGYSLEDVPDPSTEKVKHSQGKTVGQVFDRIGNFYDYGLSVDYVVPETFADQTEGYLRYQLSWGGPSEEVRFFFSPGSKVPYRIEFVYLIWGSGVGFDVTSEEWAQWLWDQFYEMGTVKSEVEKSIN